MAAGMRQIAGTKGGTRVPLVHHVTEAMVADGIDQAMVNEAVAAAFVAMADGTAVNFPVVREVQRHANAVFGLKSGAAPGLLGVKAGGLWPGNAAMGIANHQSTILLFDPDTGLPTALVAATLLTALRTAAASALSIRQLARKNAKVLGLLGAGGQALHQARAALAIHSFSAIRIANRSEEAATRLAASLQPHCPDVDVVGPEAMARSADVIITMTTARAPQILVDWVRPGTHIAAMGTDTVGKQELDTKLVASARVFVDSRDQAITIGECQHAQAAGLLAGRHIEEIGRVMSYAAPGRQSDADITVFDSSGVAMQDLYAAQLAVDRLCAKARP
jgi:ornithine cyclodeaminase/alanine dehydrogenase-like protein (mu-crystallin family)